MWIGLNMPIQGRNWQNGLLKHTPIKCCTQETHFRFKDINKLNISIENYIPNKQKLKDNWSICSNSDKIYFKTKTVTRDKEEHFYNDFKKWSIYQEHVANISIYAT